MSFIFFINIVAMIFSFFVAGALIGAIFSNQIRKKLSDVLNLLRSTYNPILKPGTHPWTAEAVMNPAAVVINNRTHLVYRAVGGDGVSRFGYASSLDGILFDDILPYPVYAAVSPSGLPNSRRIYSPVMYPSGGSWGGAEDPRMVVIDGRVYVTFNMFDNWTLRIGMISMSEKDFIAKNFGAWDGPTILSNGQREKNWMLFPEKINGKFAVLHGIIDPDENRVRIEYTDDLKTLAQKKVDTIDPQTVPDKKISWHVHVRSAGPPPIKTNKGWLVLYHAHSEGEGDRYKLGAMLLDLNDPTKVLCRATTPILSPDAQYENDGKPGIVYAGGAVIRDKKLYVYYGGADKVVCVATATLNAFLDAIIAGAEPHLEEQKAQII